MVPADFFKVLKDFTTDLLSTFPELLETLNADLLAVHSNAFENPSEALVASYTVVYEFLATTLPKHFFDILSERDDLFKAESCLLLPGIDFKKLWGENISEKTKLILWKYLKLMLLLVVGNVTDKSGFGDAAKMFDAMNDSDLKAKLDEATKDIRDFFTDAPMPNPEDMQDHLKGLMGGKLGSLAKEIADETVGDASPEKMQEMLKDPSKLFGLVHSVGDKIDKKIKAGELKESELIEEAVNMLAKIKDIPGMGGFENMFKKFAGGGKMDFGGMQGKLNKNMKAAKMKERMQQKLKERKQPEATAPETAAPETPVEAKFSTGEEVLRTPKKKKKKKKAHAE
jgi:hypothetical protein